MYRNKHTGKVSECLAIQTVEGWWISNPTPEQIEAAGWVLIPPHVRTLQDAIQEKIQDIDSYESSNEVNTFSLNDESMWISREDRITYMETIQSAKRLGLGSVYFLGMDIPIDYAILIIDSINVYVMQCTRITDLHKQNVESLLTIAEVDEYNHTIGYPEKLVFQF